MKTLLKSAFAAAVLLSTSACVTPNAQKHRCRADFHR